MPLDGEVVDNVTLWAQRCGLAANATLYASLLFGGLYLAVVAPGWTNPAPGLDWLPAIGLVTAFASSSLARLARGRNAGELSPCAWLLGSSALSGVTALACVAGLLNLGDATVHANLAVRFAVFTYCGIHASVAMLITAHAAWRCREGFVSAVRATDLRIAVLWTDYAAIVLLPAWGLLILLAQSGTAS